MLVSSFGVESLVELESERSIERVVNGLDADALGRASTACSADGEYSALRPVDCSADMYDSIQSLDRRSGCASRILPRPSCSPSALG